VAEQFCNETSTRWTIPADYLANLKYEPDERSQNGKREAGTGFKRKHVTCKPACEFDVVDLSERMQGIADGLCDIDRILKAIEEHRLTKQPLSTDEDFVMATPLQRR
jgi:hypothetical protein